MELLFCGAIDRVTGSCSLLRDPISDKQYLVDCGLIVGEREELDDNDAEFPFDAAEIDAVFLTHAHLDHCGRLPKLYREGFEKVVYATHATADLARESLKDAARHSRERVWAYTADDVDSIKFQYLDARADYEFGKSKIPLGPNFFVFATRSAHILGAVSYTFIWTTRDGEQRSICFSGDLGSNSRNGIYQPLQKRVQVPHRKTNFIVLESTYSATVRPDKYKNIEARLDRLQEILVESHTARGGLIVFPAFSVQRTQDLMFDLALLSQRFRARDSGDSPRRIALHLDSQLAQRMCAVYCEHLVRRAADGGHFWLSDEMLESLGWGDQAQIDEVIDRLYSLRTDFHDDQLLPLLNVRTWRTKALVQQDFYVGASTKTNVVNVLLTGAGMGDQGPVLRHFQNHLSSKESTFVFTGYAGPETNCGKLLALCRTGTMSSNVEIPGVGKEFVRINDKQVKAKLLDLASYYSGHADFAGLSRFVFEVDQPDATPVTIFLNHGFYNQRAPLKEALLRRAAEARPEDRTINTVEMPTRSDAWYDLDRTCWKPDAPRESHADMKKVLRLLREISARLTRLEEHPNERR